MRLLHGRSLQLAFCAVAMVASASAQYAWTLFTVPLAHGLNAQLSEIQVAFTLFILAQSWPVPVLGYVMDRLGARVVVAMGGVLVGASWVGSGLTGSLWGLYLLYAISGMGVGAVYGACVGLALKWFPDRRGLAAGMAVGAYGSGAALIVIPIRHMIEGAGYQTAFIFWGLLQGVILLAVAWPIRAPYPGWRPSERGGARAGEHERPLQPMPSAMPRAMLRSGSFYLLYVVAVLVTFGGLLVSAQLKPIAVAYGINKAPILPGTDALEVALVANLAVGAFARPFWGWLSDRIGRYQTMTLAFTAGGVAILGLLGLAHNPWGFVVFSCLTILMWGASFVLFSAAIGDAFGTQYAATNNGIHYTSKGVAAIFAGWGAAKVVEATGTWTPVLWLGVTCNLLAAALVYFVLRSMVDRAMTGRKTGPGTATPTARPVASAGGG